MRIHHLGCIAALAAFSLSAAAAAATCQLGRLGVLPVDMQSLRPVIQAKINGVNARFVLDSGGFYSIMSRDAAAQYQLPIATIDNDDFYVSGLGGKELAQLATIKKFDFLGVPLSNVQFLVVDQNVSGELTGIIGQNLLRVSDVEYDLANGTVRFFKPIGCNDQPLAYWAVRTPYSFVKLGNMGPADPQLRTSAMINGHRVTVWFDTGTARSVLSLEAAKRAGIEPGSPGVSYLGLSTGIGPAPTRVWVAPIETFQIGGEKVTHTHLLVAELEPRDPDEPASTFPDLLLGDDFFLSHRIYVAYDQNKLYFTYNGGPLFNLNLPGFASAAATAPPAGAGAQANQAPGGQAMSDAPTDAGGFRRRGMAYAAMREFNLALADLTRACELAPRDAENRYERGLIYARSGQPKSALQDLDAAITMRPDDIDAHISRAEVLLSQPDADSAASAAEIKSDLDAVSRLAAPDAGVRLTLGNLYGRLGDYPPAIDQMSQWLDSHPLDDDQAMGFNNLCWLRATANRDLRQALDDCNHALALRPQAPAKLGSLIGRDLAPESPATLDNRGLVYLRLGNLKDAIRDYDSALDTNPNIPGALYGRGLAELRLGEKTQGQADLAAAAKLESGVARHFARMGLTP